MKSVHCAAVAATVLLASTLSASAASVAASCITNAKKALASDLNFSSTSTSTYKNLPEAGITFVQSKPGCVIVTFSAEINPSGHPLGMRAYLDNTTSALPADMQFSQTSNEISAHTFTFFFPSVSTGSHSLHMQYLSQLDGMAVTVRKHNTIVEYFK